MCREREREREIEIYISLSLEAGAEAANPPTERAARPCYRRRGQPLGEPLGRQKG